MSTSRRCWARPDPNFSSRTLIYQPVWARFKPEIKNITLNFEEILIKNRFLHIYPTLTRKRSMRCTSSIRSCQPSVYHTKMGESRWVFFPTAQRVNLPGCSPHWPINAERQAGKLWIPILQSLVRPDSESNPSLQFPRRTLLPLGHLSCWKKKISFTIHSHTSCEQQYVAT